MSTKLVKRFKEPAGPFAPKPYSVAYDWNKEHENLPSERVNRDVTLPAMQQVRSVTKPIQDRYDSALKRNKQTAALLLALWNKGFFKGLKDRKGRDVTYNTAVDGMRLNKGGITNAAIEAAKAAGYYVTKDGRLEKMSDITGDMVKNTPAAKSLAVQTSLGTQLASILPSINTSEPSQQQYTEIDPRDRLDFAKWLYEQGKSNTVGNVFETGKNFVKSLFGITIPTDINESTSKQAIALHLYDNSDIVRDGNVTLHKLGYNRGTNNYKWTLLNGGEQVHGDRSLFDKAKASGEYVLGRFNMLEDDDKYYLDNENYNFNLSGTDFAKRKIDSGDSDAYDYLRYYAGSIGANKDIPVRMSVPKSTVLDWYNEYKRGKS